MEIRIDDWDKLPAQDEFYSDLKTNTLMFSGGLGSGKTHVLCRKALQLSALNRDYSGAILCPTYKDFRRDVRPEFEKILTDMGLKESEHYWFNKSYNEYSFVWNKNPLYILSGEQPIAGPNLAYCLINEFSLIQYERIKEMLRRVRVKDAKYKQRCLAGTPEDVHGWVEDFVELQQAQIDDDMFRIIFSDTRENIHVDEGYRKHLETMLDEQALKVFASGQIVRLGGDYFYYAFNRTNNVVAQEYVPENIVYVGLDFNVGKMAASFAHITIEDGKKYVRIFDELLLEGDSDTNKMCIAIKKRFDIDQVIITCDASGRARKTSGRSDVEIIKSHGFQVRHRRANPRLRERQLLVNGLMSKGCIVVDPKCKGVIKDFEKVQQNKVDYSKIKDKDDKLTHFSDGIDYLIDWEYSLSIRRSRTIQL